MKTFIAAIPLFDPDMKVVAYSLQTRNSDKPLGLTMDYLSLGDMVATDGLDAVEAVGIAPFAGDAPLLCEVNHYQLLMDVPTNKIIDPRRLVCVLPRDTKIDAAIEEKCAALKRGSYSIALELNGDKPERNSLLDMADYLTISAANATVDGARKIARMLTRKQRLVITNIPNMDTFNRYKNNLQTYFSGSFYSQPLTKGIKNISPLKVNTLHLLNEVNQDDADLSAIARTIERDPVLSVSLLRFINSPAVGMRRHIDSIRGAVAILGQNELKRWVTVALSVQLADDRPNEITKLSLIRAKFAENLAPLYEQGVFMHSLFMAGLFSLIDVILQKHMEEALAEIRVDTRVRDALLHRKGPLYDVLELVYSYERADWDHTSINLIRHGVEAEGVIKAFINALLWYKQLLDEIDE